MGVEKGTTKYYNYVSRGYIPSCQSTPCKTHMILGHPERYTTTSNPIVDIILITINIEPFFFFCCCFDELSSLVRRQKGEPCVNKNKEKLKDKNAKKEKKRARAVLLQQGWIACNKTNEPIHI